MTTTATATARASAALREHAQLHITTLPAPALTEKYEFWGWCRDVLDAWADATPEGLHDGMPQDIGRNTAYALFRELTPALTAEAARRLAA